MMFQNNFDFLIKIVLSDRDKKILVIIFLIFLLIVLLFGIINRLNHRFMEKEGKKIDSIVVGYVKYGFVNNSKDFKKIANKKNQVLYFKQSIFPLALLGVGYIAFAIFCSVKSLNWEYIFDVYQDMFFYVEKETVITDVAGIKMIGEMPTITTNAIYFHNDLNGIVAYVFLIINIIGILFYSIATIKYISRLKRIKKVSKNLFTANLDLEKFD